MTIILCAQKHIGPGTVHRRLGCGEALKELTVRQGGNPFRDNDNNDSFQ